MGGLTLCNTLIIEIVIGIDETGIEALQFDFDPDFDLANRNCTATTLRLSPPQNPL